MRMYGFENSDVVQPTNAVSATRNTLNGSTKKSAPTAYIGPCATVRAASASAAAHVRKLKPTFSARATCWRRTSARHPPAASGRPSNAGST
ncbi:Uncharacterised protein [Burkholderia pseudomallei]|nr:Uncharacterised protein [Burkholderia pseudomallei]